MTGGRVRREDLLELIRLYGLKCQSYKLLEIYDFSRVMRCADLGWKKGAKLECDQDFEHIHHIDMDRNNNDIDNLIPLCSYCHSNIHHGWPLKKGMWYDFRTRRFIDSHSRNPFPRY